MQGIEGNVALLTFRDKAGRKWTASAMVSDISLYGGGGAADIKLPEAEHFGLVLVDFTVVKP